MVFATVVVVRLDRTPYANSSPSRDAPSVLLYPFVRRAKRFDFPGKNECGLSFQFTAALSHRMTVRRQPAPIRR